MSFLSHDQTSNVNNAPNRLDTIDLLFQTGPELPDSLGTVPSDVGIEGSVPFSDLVLSQPMMD